MTGKRLSTVALVRRHRRARAASVVATLRRDEPTTDRVERATDEVAAAGRSSVHCTKAPATGTPAGAS